VDFPAFEVIDLTHTLTGSMPRCPGDPGLKLTKVQQAAPDAPLVHEVSLGDHLGTHGDAPLHVEPEGRSVDRLSADDLVLPAVMIDVRERARDNPEYRFTVADFFEWEEEFGWIPPHSAVLLHTGWGLRWHEPDRFLGKDELGTLHFPGYGADVAQFLVEERSVAALGIDTASVDVGRSSTFPVHRLAAKAGVLLMESLANLHGLPERELLVVIGVLPIRGASGAPARVLALVPKS